MTTILRDMLSRLRGQMLGWGLALAVLALIVAPLYDTAVQQRAQIEQLLGGLPPEFMALIGNLDRMFSPVGFLDARYFTLLPLLLGVFAAVMGSGLIAADEENGTLDLILAQPISRAQLFAGRLIAFAITLAGICAIGWLGLVIGTRLSTIAIGWIELALPFVSLIGVVLWFGTLALMLSLILPSRRSAAMLTGLVLVVSFFVTTLARLSPNLSRLAVLMPTYYYQGGSALDNFDLGGLVGLLLFSVIFTAIALRRFQRRDIRIAGEGGWRIRRQRFAKQTAHKAPPQ